MRPQNLQSRPQRMIFVLWWATHRTVWQWTPDPVKVLNLIEKKHFGFEMDGMLLQDTTIALPADATDLSQFFSVVKA